MCREDLLLVDVENSANRARGERRRAPLHVLRQGSELMIRRTAMGI